MWITILVMIVLGSALWTLERRLARKDAAEQARLREAAKRAAHRARTEIKQKTQRRRES